MLKETIAEVGIDASGRLYVKPCTISFDYIYRAAKQVNWDQTERRLFSPKPRDWTYLDWFKQIEAAAVDEYRTRLVLTADTIWINVPPTIQAEISSLSNSD